MAQTIYGKKDKLQKWVYKVKTMYILYGGKKTNLPFERLNQLSIICDYMGSLYPLVEIKVVLDADQYYEIKKHKNDLQFFIRIDKAYIKETGKNKKKKYSAFKVFMSGKYDIIMDDNTENMEISIETDEVKNNYKKKKKKKKDEYEEVDNEVTFYLYKRVDELKSVVNVMLEKANVTDAVAWLMTQAHLNNVIMQQPDNTAILDNIFIPPMSISKALYHLDNYYGLYQFGTIFFFDFKYSYIIPFDGRNRTAFLSGEPMKNNIVIPKKGAKNHSSEVGVLLKKKSSNQNYIVGSNDTIGMSNPSISGDLISGSDSDTIDDYTGENELVKSGAIIKTDSPVARVDFNKTENPFFSTMKTAVSKSSSTVISVDIADYDYDMITPNKMYNMLFEDTQYMKKYSGIYTLTEATHSFVKDGENLMLSTTLELRKMK